jgi:superfamily II DNA helicase RecQ
MAQYTEQELCTALKYHFGHELFRPFQLDAVQATLSGRDSLLILPTGGGKSLTFQLPALAKGNCFTVVVGPLMALAKDQVTGLDTAGVLLPPTACLAQLTCWRSVCRWTAAWTWAWMPG